MILIGEKINGTRKQVAKAIQDRDSAFIRDLARSQAENGASYLDINAGTLPLQEPEDMAWLVQKRPGGCTGSDPVSGQCQCRCSQSRNRKGGKDAHAQLTQRREVSHRRRIAYGLSI